MRWSRAVLFLLALVLQTSILPQVVPSGLKPDLLLVFAVLIGLHVGPREGFWWGALAGLLLDLFTGRFLGFQLATKALAAYVSGVIGLKLYRHNPGVPAVLGGATTIVQELAFLALLRINGLAISLTYALTANILPHALMNLLIAAVFSGIVYGVFRSEPHAVETRG